MSAVIQMVRQWWHCLIRLHRRDTIRVPGYGTLRQCADCNWNQRWHSSPAVIDVVERRSPVLSYDEAWREAVYLTFTHGISHTAHQRPDGAWEVRAE